MKNTKALFKQEIDKNLKYAVNSRSEKKSIKIRPINQVGHYSHSQYGADHTKRICEYLEELKLKYTIGNDAPKGGQLGKFIEVRIDKRNTFLKTLVK